MFYWFLVGILALSVIGHLITLGFKEIQPRSRWAIAVDAGISIVLVIGCLLWL